MTVPQAFDSLIAKLIVTGATRTEALERSRRALAEFRIEGMPTVLPFHLAVVDDPAFTGSSLQVHTRWIETEFAGDIPPYAGTPGDDAESAERERVTVEVGGKRLEVTLPAGFQAAGGGTRASAPGAGRARRGARRGGGAAPSGNALVSPMQGTIVKIVAAEGQQVSAGDTIVLLEAMKMEQPLTAHKDGTVRGLTVQVGETVSAGAVICELGE
jgi:acetyl-CoA/propionyl-CoA carboxylase, biotin carboxylase, biotin carboxyl carrier protein